MKKEDLRIVFMGTPEFAVESLKALVEGGYNVVGVITMPDKPAGRGYKMQQSAVKKYALDNELLLLQPEKLKNETFLDELRNLHADLQIVVAFRMLPEAVWAMPAYGTFNLHASLLPQYRGAAPINWAIINGEKETGVTTFFLTHEIDTGKIIFQEKIRIEEEDNAETVHDKLMRTGAGLVIKTVDAVINGNIEATPQSDFAAPETGLRPAPKIFKETCKINWDQPAEKVYDFIRGLSPYPAAWTELMLPGEEPINLKIFAAAAKKASHGLNPGSVTTDNKTYLDVAVADGYIRLSDIQAAGKKRMNVKDFLNGFAITAGSRVE